jgi:hypothetical protein
VATLGFLAIHQEEQATAYAEIMANIPSDRDPVCIFFVGTHTAYDDFWVSGL